VNSRFLALAAILSLLTGCGGAHYKTQADREVYSILQRKQELVLGAGGAFTIEQDGGNPLVGLPRVRPEPLGDMELASAAVLTLPQSLEIGTKSNRDYQSRKEELYLSALDLTLARHTYGPIFSSKASAEYSKTKGDEKVAGQAGLGLSKLFADGTKIGVDITTDLLTHLVRSPREAASSIITATLTKPLWRGAGTRIAQENLVQAERDVVYSIRSFSRYHGTFAIEIAAAYYRLLQERDTVLNAWNNYQNLIQARERTQMLAEAGRLPEFQVDQAKQNELRSQDLYIRSQQSYLQALDELKIELGLPTDSAVTLDPAELDALRRKGIVHPKATAEEAIEIALKARLDYANVLDQVEDGGRKVEVAKNGLAPDVDLKLTSWVPTEKNRPWAFSTANGTYTAGVDADLPIDRKSERNTYRRTLINLERAKREATLFADQVKLDVRQAWRKLQEAKASYDNQQLSLALAVRRVESTSLLLQAGRADTRDLLESQDALLEAQNALTRALIDHTIARLEFWRDIGILKVDENGLWEEDYSRLFERVEEEPPRP